MSLISDRIKELEKIIGIMEKNREPYEQRNIYHGKIEELRSLAKQIDEIIDKKRIDIPIYSNLRQFVGVPNLKKELTEGVET